jgi:adenylosuccinate synthase
LKARIVIGANFGDEGKGLVTDYLCSQGAGMVVRYNGGCQAGHTVVTPDKERHVFHHFGSGTFCEVPTFLSQFFVLNPILFFKERDELIRLGFHPEVYAHPDCLVTTFMDMLINQHKETKRGAKRHGSCGVGVHETMQRSLVSELKITMSDLWNGGKRLPDQLVEICGQYAKYRTGQVCDVAFQDKAIEEFIKCCAQFAQCVNPLGIGQCKDPVFEGAQGLLLDQNNKEFFPHVTHSNTGMANVEVLCAQAAITEKEVYYVSRTYLTRHGAGPLPGEDASLSFADDTNVANEFQGKLRFAPLDERRLIERIMNDAGSNPYKLVLTHCDQLAPSCLADFYCDGPTRESVVEDVHATVEITEPSPTH